MFLQRSKRGLENALTAKTGTNSRQIRRPYQKIQQAVICATIYQMAHEIGLHADMHKDTDNTKYKTYLDQSNKT